MTGQVCEQAHGGLLWPTKSLQYFTTMEDAGAMPIEMPVDKMSTGQVIDVYPYEGVVKDNATGEVI